MPDQSLPDQNLSRRTALTAIAIAASGTLVPRALLAAPDDALLAQAQVCALTPQVTEGPYYLDADLVRRAIAEGRDGAPLLVRMQVVDPSCRPIPNARVDIWHCDAQGIYSAYGGADRGQSSPRGETFMRGTQMADRNGVVEFDTVYPGWYRGRTTHIHFKVFPDRATEMTGQMFFPDDLSEQLYRDLPAYSRNRPRDTMNANDGIARRATAASVASLRPEGGGYLAQLIVAVAPRQRADGMPVIETG